MSGCVAVVVRSFLEGPVVQFCGPISFVGFSLGNVWEGRRGEPGSSGPVRVGPRWLPFFCSFIGGPSVCS